MDLRLYLVTSGADAHTVEVARAVAGAGAGVVQVRAKDLAEDALAELATVVARAVATANPATRVLIDDNVAVAARLMAAGEAVHGVHLGQDDMPVREARRILGPDAIIGLTTGTLELVQAANAVADAVDYLGAGPLRLTPTKDSGRPPLGLVGYPPLVAATALPIVAIGDVTLDDVADLADTGVAGVCMVRALMCAQDPGAVAAQALRDFDALSRAGGNRADRLPGVRGLERALAAVVGRPGGLDPCGAARGHAPPGCGAVRRGQTGLPRSEAPPHRSGLAHLRMKRPR